VLTQSIGEIANIQTNLHAKYSVHNKGNGDGDKLCLTDICHWCTRN